MGRRVSPINDDTFGGAKILSVVVPDRVLIIEADEYDREQDGLVCITSSRDGFHWTTTQALNGPSAVQLVLCLAGVLKELEAL